LQHVLAPRGDPCHDPRIIDQTAAETMDRAITTSRRLAAGTIAVAVGVLALKVAAYLATGSLALYSDALESIVNVVTAVITAAALTLSARPPDRHHQYGHHKAEYLAAVIEGVLIVLAAAAIFRAAADAVLVPKPFELTALGLGLSALATVINAAWAYRLITRGRASRSPALVADGWHLATDVVSSIAVLLGLLLVAATGVKQADAILALMVALYILWTGARLLRESMSGLMDEAVTSDVAREIRAVISSNADGALEAHDIKTRMAGRVTYIEFHLVVPARMTVKAAHDICDRVEAALTAALPGAEVLIHVEPEGEAKRTGAVVL
jgi:cation diffusion facilitator family transporter